MKRNEIAALHARTTNFQSKVRSAQRIVQKAFEIDDSRPYVALSGGKDSTVVFDLARHIMPSISGVWSDDEWWLPETLAYVERLQVAGYDVQQIRTNAHHADWFEVEGDYDGIPDYASRKGWNLVFLGLRQEESGARRVHLRTFGPLFKTASGVWHCNPIHNWTWRDVWAYIVSRGIDYNRAYDRLEVIGVEPQYQRIGPFAVERALGFGQLAILKKGWPDLYNKFCQAHPEARSYD